MVGFKEGMILWYQNQKCCVLHGLVFFVLNFSYIHYSFIESYVADSEDCEMAYVGIPFSLALHRFLPFTPTQVLSQPGCDTSIIIHSHCLCIWLTCSVYEFLGDFMLLCQVHMNLWDAWHLSCFPSSFVPRPQIT